MTSAAELDEAVRGDTVPAAFVRTARRRREGTALRWRMDGGGWLDVTWGSYADRAARMAGGLKALGIERGDRVVLMIRNRPEFHIADMGVLLAGATPISIYNSSSPEQVQYLTSHSEASMAIVEDIGFLERFLKVRTEL